MNAKRVSVNQRRDQKNQPKPAIEAVGTEALFSPAMEDTEGTAAESIEDRSSQQSHDSPPAAAENKSETKQQEELVKTTAYIEESKFLALEELQLKLKRKEKRRVTKNELFNKAIELLIEHYEE